MSVRPRVMPRDGLTMAALATGCTGMAERVRPPRIIPPPQPDLIRDLQERTFRFFWETTDAETGLAPDLWPTPAFASIAAMRIAIAHRGSAYQWQTSVGAGRVFTVAS